MTRPDDSAPDTEAGDNTPVPSPCVSICLLDENDVCTGCFRTAEEIGLWGVYSNAEKQAVIEKIRRRLSTDDGSNYQLES